MSRDATKTESLVQELSAFYGDDLDFAIINDIVRSNSDAAEESIFDLLSEITGRLYIRPHQAQEPEPVEMAPTSAASVLARLTKPPAKQTGKKPKKAALKPSLVAETEYNSFQALDTDNPEPIEKKPFESIWSTVLKEHHAPNFEDKPLPDPNADSGRFEDVDLDALEDVDPVVFEIENNLELRAQPTAPVAYDYGLYADDEPIISPPIGFRPVEPREVPKPVVAPLSPQVVVAPASISSQPVQSPSQEHIPMVMMPGGAVLPAWMVKTASPSLEVSAVPSISSAPVITISSDSNAPSYSFSSSFSSSGSILLKQPTQTDFWLPPPPTNEAEAKRILDQLALSSSSQGSVRASAKWSHSGDFAIAPSPSAIRHSVGVQGSASGTSASHSDEVTPGNPEDDFKLDTEALDFLGQIFPDFEATYLADCLRGAENDVQRVSEFLLPVEMENIDIGDEELEEVYDYSQHIFDRANTNSNPVFEFPTYLLSDKHFYSIPMDSHAASSSASDYPSNDLEAPFVMVDDDGVDGEDDDGHIPDADVNFNLHFQNLLAAFDGVDPDLVLDALITHNNDVERAGEDIMARLAAGEAEQLPKSGIKPTRPNQRGGRRNNRRGGRQGGRSVVPLDAPNAWARPLPGPAVEPLSGFPELSPEMLARAPKDGSPIVIRPPRQSTVAHVPPQVSHLLPRGTFAPRAAKLPKFPMAPGAMPDELARPQYVPSGRVSAASVAPEQPLSGNSWIDLMTRANKLFEESGHNRNRAIRAYMGGGRKNTIQIVSSFQSNTEDWIALVEQAARDFYASGVRLLDLHGLRLRPATKFVAAILQAHWEVGTSARVVEIITGRGAHSVDGVARIKEDVRRQIREYPHVWTNPGSVRVLLPKPQPHY